MRCESCGFENSEGTKFCEECGAKFRQVCPSCGHEVRPTAKFCGECGAVLTGKEPENRRTGEPEKRSEKSSSLQTLDPRPQTLDSSRPEAERRQLTVMFCDLVGSTALSEQLDPEEWRKVVQTYQETCAAVVNRFDGHIAQYLGDGLLVYFGYPTAHEDDAQRAVRTGLDIVEALQKWVPSPPVGEALQRLQVRIGIHTGLVVVGEIGGGRHEQLALGDTPNIAARLQGLAEPNTVVISAATHRLIAGFFDCHDGGLQSLKGVSVPVQVYRVLSESSARSRLEVEVSTGRLTPLVGRAHEVGLILDRWAAAQAGDGQVMLLNGEPGIGKSRLVQEVKEQVVQRGALYLEFRCSPYTQNSAFSPVLTYLQRVLQFARDDTPQEKLAKLQRTLVHYRFPQADTLPLLAALLSLPLPSDVPPLNLSPQKQKQKTQEVLVAWLLEEAERCPVYCVWEDLHWADPSTLELLGLLLDQVPTARLLVLLTARPEFTPPWSSRTHLTSLTLTRLPRTQAAEMINKVTGGKPLPAEVQQQIVNKTDGVPLFVEELTKMVIESIGSIGSVESIGSVGLHGRSPLPLEIPATLHDSLMARLDRLGTAKEVAQLGATLGREFAHELIQAVATLDETDLQGALSKLVEAEILYQRGVGGQIRYFFKHALIQDTAYQSLLKSRRQEYHQQIAQVLEQRFVEITDTQPELVAHHYTEAGLIEQAIPYWQRAGERAVQRSANVEAISHLTKGLRLLTVLPTTPERTHQALALQIALGIPLVQTKGFSAPEVDHTYSRARGLCQQLGETPQLFPALRGLWAFYQVRADYQTALTIGEQLLSLAQRVQDSSFLVEAHQAMGWSLYFRGQLLAAKDHLERVVAIYDLEVHRSHVFRYGGGDPGVACLSLVAWTWWELGYPEQARKRNDEALALAQELSHPFSLAFALNCSAILYQYYRQGQVAQEWAAACCALSTEQEFPHWLAQGTILQGWALAEQGRGEEGIAQIHQGLATHRAIGAELHHPYFLALLAQAYGKTGQVEEGLAVLAEALTVVDRAGERYYEAELYRLKGELVLQSGVRSPQSKNPNPQSPTPNPQTEAEACFLKAIEISRKQQAKSLELRAVMSLSRLWRQQGKKNEARQMLAEIYNWFTEGFDTKDLQEAKALLEN
jgi:TOMM system kinase/cyclase fusion protein